jgi:gas vesicle protein
MTDRHTIVGGAVLGALVGAVAGYLFFTERGRRFRRDVEPDLQTIVREAMRVVKSVRDLRQTRSPMRRAVGSSTPLAWPRQS